MESVDPLSAYGPVRLGAMLEAGRALQSIAADLAGRGSHPVAEALQGADAFVEAQHYPPGDVFDAGSHAQFYYHAHDAGSGARGQEHGHFHAFLRRPGIAPALLAGTRTAGEPAAHLVAVGMDAWGAPLRLFAVNRWVTDEIWLPERAVLASLDRFHFAPGAPPLAHWLAALLVLFRPEIAGLLRKRDEVIANQGSDIFEDRRLEVLASVDISIDRQMRRVRRALSRAK